MNKKKQTEKSPIQEKIDQINELGKRFGLGDAAENVRLWELLYDNSIRNFIFFSIRKNKLSSLQKDTFELGFTDAVIYFLNKADPESIRSKVFFSFFTVIVYDRIVDNHRKDTVWANANQITQKNHAEAGERNDGYLSRTVSFNAKVGDGTDASFEDILSDSLSVKQDPQEGIIIEEELLYCCHLIVNLNEHRPDISADHRRKAICYRMLFTNLLIPAVREGYEQPSVFSKHERDFWNSMDPALTAFTYRTAPENLRDVCIGILKTYREMGIEGRNIDSEPALPFITSVVLAVLDSAYDIHLTAARLSQLRKDWNAYMSSSVAATEE